MNKVLKDVRENIMDKLDISNNDKTLDIITMLEMNKDEILYILTATKIKDRKHETIKFIESNFGSSYNKEIIDKFLRKNKIDITNPLKIKIMVITTIIFSIIPVCIFIFAGLIESIIFTIIYLALLFSVYVDVSNELINTTLKSYAPPMSKKYKKSPIPSKVTMKDLLENKESLPKNDR